MYDLEYLPAARKDLVDIVRYISQELQNPDAAEHLAIEMIEIAEKTQIFPYANPAHHPIRPLKNEYRKVFVQNYVMFYWVDEKKKRITIARVLYAKRDSKQLLE